LGLSHRFSYQNWPFKVAVIKGQGQIDIGIRAKNRRIAGSKKSYQLSEPAIPYGASFTPKSGLLKLKNICFWDDII
jgi:hypothetical protein